MARTEPDLHAYVHDLEEHLKQTLFDRGAADSKAAVLLVRGALAAGERSRAAELAAATARLVAKRPGDRDMAAAGAHVRGLLDADLMALKWAAAMYVTAHGQAWATEDAGMAWAQRGERAEAVAWLRRAYAMYEQLGAVENMARVRARLRTAEIRVRHRARSDRPAFGWDSLTDTERRIVELVAQGLSNRQVASQMFLSVHTIAFHLRRVFCKLDVTSRVQLARLAAERAGQDVDGYPEPVGSGAANPG